MITFHVDLRVPDNSLTKLNQIPFSLNFSTSYLLDLTQLIVLSSLNLPIRLKTQVWPSSDPACLIFKEPYNHLQTQFKLPSPLRPQNVIGSAKAI